MKQFTLKKKVAGVTLQVPIYESEKVTDQLIEEVNARFKDIESSSSRIDTHAFALLTALSLAADLRASQEARRSEGERLLRTVRKLTESLRSLIRDHSHF